MNYRVVVPLKSKHELGYKVDGKLRRVEYEGLAHTSSGYIYIYSANVAAGGHKQWEGGP